VERVQFTRYALYAMPVIFMQHVVSMCRKCDRDGSPSASESQQCRTSHKVIDAFSCNSQVSLTDVHYIIKHSIS